MHRAGGLRGYFEAKPEVADAVRDGEPVVALESTLISHGLPRPDNLALAREVEGIARGEGAAPAAIGMIGGVAKIGLADDEIELLAEEDGIPKLSARDLPMAAARGSHGATTVAATAHLAGMAGIKLFATGGLGGVHREARESWDVSADPGSLARAPVAVVCSGVKSILDVPATLEYLETLGVPVVGFGSRSFAGFYLSDSGHTLDWHVESEEEAADVVRAMGWLGFGGTGLVVSNPIPEGSQLDPRLHDEVLAAGLRDLERLGVGGKDVTPFLLGRFHEGTGGESLAVNKEIIRRNVRLAAGISVALSKGK
ncbi:MAG: pseudouridine-5'-phosphate glycosidase [Rubrobacter sp.]|nr:pseudouridine-5'-phosphate glycosidase [Rubrobacter sp.]